MTTTLLNRRLRHGFTAQARLGAEEAVTLTLLHPGHPTAPAGLLAVLVAAGLRPQPADGPAAAATLAAAVEALTGHTLLQCKAAGLPAGEVYYTHARPVTEVPPALAAHGVTFVGGLCNLPLVRAKARRAAAPAAAAAARTAPPVPLTTSQVAALYRFPTAGPRGTPARLDGTGKLVGIIELGGALRTAVSPPTWTHADVYGLYGRVNVVSVAGGRNDPTSDLNAKLEVELDVQVVHRVAPGATINVYFAPNDTGSFVQALVQAAADRCDVVSISWGLAEPLWGGPLDMAAMNAALRTLSDQGAVVFAASGDWGTTDGYTSGLAVDFPASSPNCVACGGTRLVAPATETVWNNGPTSATGGGRSAVWPKPTFQAGLDLGHTFRAVPDLVANADPVTGYLISYPDGVTRAVGGTSAVAPLMAGLMALIKQATEPLPDSPKISTASFLRNLYASRGSVCADVTSGSVAPFAAAAGYDIITGCGRLKGDAVLGATWV